MKISNRWVFVIIFFFFLFFQELDRQIINQITPEMTGLFYSKGLGFLNDIPWPLIVSLIFFFIWGILFDSHDRRRLFSVVGFVWAISSLMMGIAPTFNTFNISRAIGGLNNASYSGISSLLGDYFKPNNRGKMLGLLLLSRPLALFLSILFIPILFAFLNWRFILYGIAGVAVLFSLSSFFFIHEPIRGNKEPALIDIKLKGQYLFDWENANFYLKQPSMVLIYFLGFFSIIPWTLTTSWATNFLLSSGINPDVSTDLYNYILPSLIAIVISFPLGGFLGDLFFQWRKTGRILVSMAGIGLSVVSLVFVYFFRNTSSELLLMALVSLGLFFSFSWPNLIASILDITLPELRASASGIFLFFQAMGVFVSPFLAALVNRMIGLIGSITWVCLAAWVICLILFFILTRRIPKDIEQFRKHMAYRSFLEMRMQAPITQRKK